MIKRNILIGMIVIFVIFSGVCYSCKYSNNKAVLLSAGKNNTDNKDMTDSTDGIRAEQGADLYAQSDKATAADLYDALSDDDTHTEKVSDQTEMIAVHICGAVINSGVYKVRAGSRLCELIELAGGLTEDAAGDYINQAEKAADGQRYYIPTVKELEDLPALEKYTGGQTADSKEKNGLVNINTATEDELMTLPGIGEAKAKSIIDYRKANGRFKTTDELMNIPGIKEGLYSKISSGITVK